MSRIAGKLSRFTQPEIKDLFAKARLIVRNQAFTLLMAPQTGEYGKILLIASRRVGNAPQRNKLKRRARALFYEEKLYKKGFDCILIFKKNASSLSYEEFKNLILKGFEKIHTQKKPSVSK